MRARRHKKGESLRFIRRVVHNAAQTRTSPARLALVVFLGMNVLFTAILSLPIANADGRVPPLVDAAFTAVSAVCVTGLSTVDIATTYTVFGKVMLMLAMKIGGLGVLTIASLLGLSVMRHMGLAQRIVTARETRSEQLSEVGSVLKTLVITSTLIEFLIFATLAPYFLSRGDHPGSALFNAAFYGISAFNNVGFVPEAEGVAQYTTDPFVAIPLALGVFIGSLGFPVILVLMRRWRTPEKWSLHAKLTLSTTFILLVAAMVGIGALEWNNPDTLGGVQGPGRFLAIAYAGVMPRSGGLGMLDTSLMHSETWLLQDILMFIGGGSGSTAGGIKVTTFAILVLSIVAEIRGDRDVEVFNRRLPEESIRQAIGVLAISVIVVFTAVLTLLRITDFDLGQILLEVCSGYGTVGLSTGITADLPTAGKAAIIACMLLGRLGPVTVGAALAMRTRQRVVRMPAERPIIG